MNAPPRTPTLCLALVVACGGSESEPPSEDGIVALSLEAEIASGEARLGECRIAMERTLGDADAFGYVDDLLWLDDRRLLVLDLLSPPFYKVIDRSVGEIIHRFGARGEGPEEFQGPTSAYRSPTDADLVEIYDFANQRITFVHPGDGQRAPSFVRELPFRSARGLVGLEPYGDRYVGIGRFADYTLVLMDEDGDLVENLVTDPPFDPEDTGGNPNFSRLLNDARLAGHGSDFAVAYRGESLLDLIDLGERSYVRVEGPRPTVVQIEMRDDGMYVGDADELAYTKVVATDRFIFAVYNGLTNAERREVGPGGGTSRHVQVFDWDGHYIIGLELERGITAIEVSPDHRLMWTGLAEPYPLVAEWRLPPLDELLDSVGVGADPAGFQPCPDGS